PWMDKPSHCLLIPTHRLALRGPPRLFLRHWPSSIHSAVLCPPRLVAHSAVTIWPAQIRKKLQDWRGDKGDNPRVCTWSFGRVLSQISIKNDLWAFSDELDSVIDGVLWAIPRQVAKLEETSGETCTGTPTDGT
ncbi:16133_t:CDS:2, partial [Acaulospora colombiana]